MQGSEQAGRTMNIELRGRRALVSGSTAGIGFAVAKCLAHSGAAVVVNGRTDTTVNRAVARIREAVAGASVQGVVADAASSEGAETLIAAGPEIDFWSTTLASSKSNHSSRSATTIGGASSR
jgi:short-subunit dehydrogenase